MLVIGESTCQTLLEHNYGSMVIFAVAWGEQSPLSSGMAQKSTHLPEYWPTGDFWSRCPLLAPRWPEWCSTGRSTHLKGCRVHIGGDFKWTGSKNCQKYPRVGKMPFSGQTPVRTLCRTCWRPNFPPFFGNFALVWAKVPMFCRDESIERAFPSTRLC